MVKWLAQHLGVQFRVIVPISMFLLFFLYVILHASSDGVGYTLMGLVASAVGLGLFMLGLEIGLMPLGQEMGRLLPRQVPVWVMLILVFLLGCGCTFAEPAVNALQLAGTLVDQERSPYLWLFLAEPSYVACSSCFFRAFCRLMLSFRAVLHIIRHLLTPRNVHVVPTAPGGVGCRSVLLSRLAARTLRRGREHRYRFELSFPTFEMSLLLQLL
jgi:hypothetical protein